MSPSVTQTKSTSASAAGAGSSASAVSSTAPVTENMFLQLLVAQLENQDPTNPADSTQFVTQLAQFQTMEQTMNQGQTMTSMLTDLNQIVAALPTASAAGSSGSTGAAGTTAAPTN
jgi:flagellar basal-body rod modification protein FlgD